jgi:hypothetical protein
VGLAVPRLEAPIVLSLSVPSILRWALLYGAVWFVSVAPYPVQAMDGEVGYVTNFEKHVTRLFSTIIIHVMK